MAGMKGESYLKFADFPCQVSLFFGCYLGSVLFVGPQQHNEKSAKDN